jgi:uncharacterized protein (TIGR00255 family)
MVRNKVYSMTGFGSSLTAGDGVEVSVEIRSVNHRGMKLNVRSRPSLGVYEKNLRDLVGGKLSRGAVDVFVNLRRTGEPESLPIREEYAKKVVASLRKLSRELNLDESLRCGDLLRIPDVFEYQGLEDSITVAEWELVEQASVAALAQVLEMRLAEGETTASRLAELVMPLSAYSVFAREYAPKVVERSRERLKVRLTELSPDGLSAGDESSLEREICLFADKSDINEEMDRLSSHLEQFAKALEEGGEIGKRIEFLAQEFLREINTSASKANDSEIVTRAVEAKLAVEKIKEQAANIE